jgi:uncharacterized membrane protein YphA (DoxX/SURF4 family)
MSYIARSATKSASRKRSAALWAVQILLALVFLFAGGFKLAAPIEMLKGPVALPGAFLRFIGLCETLGALGLILPGAFRIRTELTPFAASGLVIIMIGATAVTAIGGAIAPALIPATIGCLAVVVAVGRWRVAPLAARASRGAQSAELARPIAPRKAA